MPLVLMLIGLGFLYWLTASRTVQGGDTGEFITVAFSGGVAHPPGYPLYILVARSISWIPLINPAYALSLVSGAFALVTVILLYAAVRSWNLSVESGLVAAVTLALAPLFWRYAGVAEVFTLNTAIGAGLVWAAGRSAGPVGIARAATIGLLVGLGLANHHTIVLLAPIAAVGVLRAVRERPRAVLLVLVTAVGTIVVGLAPYLTLLGGASSSDAWSWGGHLGFDGLLSHFLRRDFGTSSLGVVDMAPSFGENHAAFGLEVLRSFHVLVPLALVGVALSIGALRGIFTLRDSALDAVGLVGSLTLILVFFAVINLRPVGLAANIVERFYILPFVVVGMLLAVGIDWMLDPRPTIRPFFRYFAVGAFSVTAVANIASSSWADDTAVEDYLINALDSVPPRSVIIGTGDMHFGFLAMNEVYSHRTDITYVDLHLLRYRWYYDRVRNELPHFNVDYDPETTRLAAVVYELTRHSPVFVTEIPEAPNFFSGPQFYAYPVGPLLAVVVAPSEGLPRFPSPDELETLNRGLFNRMTRRGRPPLPNSWGSRLYQHYRRTWIQLAAIFEAYGDEERAESVRGMADTFRIEGETL